jgi:hypothetical protein
VAEAQGQFENPEEGSTVRSRYQRTGEDTGD